jgi:hypothetical protein
MMKHILLRLSLVVKFKKHCHVEFVLQACLMSMEYKSSVFTHIGKKITKIPLVSKYQHVEMVSLQEDPPWESMVQLSLQLPPPLYSMKGCGFWP